MQRLNGVSTQKVKEATGRDWEEWIELLDQRGAGELDHKAIVELVLAEAPRPWWAQMVTVGYEQAKGRRVRNQNTDGFQVSVSKTFEAPLGKVYKAWNEFLGEWYDGDQFRITTNNKDKGIRGRFDNGAVFAMGLLATKTGKTQLAIGIEKLASATAAEAARGQWKRQLDQLEQFLR